MSVYGKKSSAEIAEFNKLFYKAMSGDMEAYYKLSPINRIEVDNYLGRQIDIFAEDGDHPSNRN